MEVPEGIEQSLKVCKFYSCWRYQEAHHALTEECWGFFESIRWREESSSKPAGQQPFDQNTLSSQYGSSLLFVKIGDLVMCIRFIMVLDDVWSGLYTHYIPITGMIWCCCFPLYPYYIILYPHYIPMTSPSWMIWCCCFPHRLEHKLSTGAWPGSGSISQRPRASAPVTIHPKKARAARSIPRRSWPGLPIFPKLLGTFGGMNWRGLG